MQRQVSGEEQPTSGRRGASLDKKRWLRNALAASQVEVGVVIDTACQASLRPCVRSLELACLPRWLAAGGVRICMAVPLRALLRAAGDTVSHASADEPPL